tara:strand:- start:368 stop:616 length:249 start_codon:yes stop_codon:yes gene_type:complete
MAKQLTEEVKFDQCEFSEQWCNGKAWVAIRGIDFEQETSIELFRANLHNRARARGMKVKTKKLSNDEILFRFIDEAAEALAE